MIGVKRLSWSGSPGFAFERCVALSGDHLKRFGAEQVAGDIGIEVEANVAVAEFVAEDLLATAYRPWGGGAVTQVIGDDGAVFVEVVFVAAGR